MSRDARRAILPTRRQWPRSAPLGTIQPGSRTTCRAPRRHGARAHPGRPRARRAPQRVQGGSGLTVLQGQGGAVIWHGESCTRVFPVFRTVSRLPRPDNEGSESLQS